jgi:hypothetical protein
VISNAITNLILAQLSHTCLYFSGYPYFVSFSCQLGVNWLRFSLTLEETSTRSVDLCQVGLLNTISSVTM